MATPNSDVGPASIVVMTSAKGFVVDGLNGTGVLMSLPSVLTVDSATITPLEPSNLEVVPPLETVKIAQSTGSETATHKVIIIIVAVSLGLTCTVSLFVFIIACWRRRKVNKDFKSMAKSARSSLEIRCIGIERTEPDISPVPPLKTKATSAVL